MAQEQEKDLKEKDNNKKEAESTQGEKEAQKEKAEQEKPEDKKKPEKKQEEQEDPLKKALDDKAKLADQLLRTMAEFDNYRKRVRKEKADLILNGAEKTITAILPIVDDMERAMANADKTDDPKKIEEGWELIVQKLHKTLEGLGVKKIDTKDADFNTDFHEAVAMVPGMGDDKKGKVIDCVQSGYTLNNKVIRHAKVAIGQ